MIYEEPICIKCKHYSLETGTCEAFKGEIPDEIYLGDNNHSKPLLNQNNNIGFEAA